MKLVESSDGTITVIELDPTKLHWLIMDIGAMSENQIAQIRMKDGQILLKRPGRQLTVIEGDSLPQEIKLLRLGEEE